MNSFYLPAIQIKDEETGPAQSERRHEDEGLGLTSICYRLALKALCSFQLVKMLLVSSLEFLELQFSASKLPRAGSYAWHFLVGSWPGGGSSRPSLRPRGCLLSQS